MLSRVADSDVDDRILNWTAMMASPPTSHSRSGDNPLSSLRTRVCNASALDQSTPPLIAPVVIADHLAAGQRAACAPIRDRPLPCLAPQIFACSALVSLRQRRPHDTPAMTL